MDPFEALSIIDKVCSQVSLNRQGHLSLQEAIQTLQAAIPSPIEVIADQVEDKKKAGKNG